MPVVAGVDSCPGGWFAVTITFFEEIVSEDHHLVESVRELLDGAGPPACIAVDIPMGLLEVPAQGGRDCDRELRKVLGQPRSSSVFSPPVRPALGCRTFEEARGYGLNRQSFGILPKVRELDLWMTPVLQARIREAHPELSFYVMAGLAPARSAKKGREGKEERRVLLEGSFHQVEEGLGLFPSSKVGPDDVLDAYACAWTAMRIFRGEAGCLPDHPPRDAKGLQMGIWY